MSFDETGHGMTRLPDYNTRPARCKGSGLAPSPRRYQADALRPRGYCSRCGSDYQLTKAGNIPAHSTYLRSAQEAP